MKRNFLSFAVFATFLFSQTLWAEVAPAQQAVETFVKNVKAMEFPVKDAGAHEKLVKATDDLLDLDAMGRKSLAAHWDQATPEERKNFLDLLWKLIRNVAYPKSRNFMGQYEITYPEVKPAGEGFDVSSVVKQQEQALDASVIYHVYQKDGQWKLDDVQLDGVSITEDLKYQFDKLIAKSGFPGLLDKMRERLAQAEKENAPA